MTDTRIDPPLTGGEREGLRVWLDWHRATLEHKCAGLSDEQLRLKAAGPSQLSLLGLVRHMAEVERTWFRRVFARQDIALVWSADGDFQVAYDATDADAEQAWAAWRAEVEQARAIEADAGSLDERGYQAKWGEEVSLRWILVHMIEEYARHNGHADLIREAIDGVTGE
ncbi:DinB family protein [Angustibacter sp. McL0619]|uniref:DinB family protein n=1 Tax=Angustibacter sp. McL0619 TaxID=3415676 RepID=UPI003CEEE9C9